MKQVWSVEERIFKGGYGIRMKLFEAIMRAIMLCDVRIDQVQLNWVLGLEKNKKG